MARVEIVRESETPGGWCFVVRIEGGTVSEHEVRLAWVDHDFWSGGAVPPSQTVRRVLEAALAARPELGIPDRLDASNLRRMVPGLDQLVKMSA